MLLCLMEIKATKLKRLDAKHTKNVERFQTAASAMFHPYAVELCKKIKKGIPEFEGCQLAMRLLFLEPRNLMIPVKDKGGMPDDELHQERLQNIMDFFPFYESSMWQVLLPAATLQALEDLDELANYIDDNYSNVSELCVTKEELK